jgi:1,4-dihydroxy-2-naphthoate octaprenyltransferase
MKYDDSIITLISRDLNISNNNNRESFIHYLKEKIGDYLFPLFYYLFMFQIERKSIDLLCIIIETIQLLSFPLNYRVSKFYI